MWPEFFLFLLTERITTNFAFGFDCLFRMQLIVTGNICFVKCKASTPFTVKWTSNIKWGEGGSFIFVNFDVMTFECKKPVNIIL